MRLYGKFTKIEKQADGTLYVEGIASSEAVDSQGEVVKASAIAAALPDYLKFPALREMHQLIAAGKTLALDVGEDGRTHIAAKVVDPVAVKKVEEGVYAGFSIGGTVPPGGRSKDNPKIIEVLKLSEISLVDRPANPEAIISLVKIEESPAAEKAPPAAEAKKAEPPAANVKKGMFTVGWAAELCQSISSLASDTQWEADFEGDESAIPERLKALCVEMCDILRALVEEETAELTAAKGTEAVALAVQPGVLKKSERVAALARAFLAGAGKKPPELPELAELRKRVVEAEAATQQAGEALQKVTAERNDLHKKHADATLALKAKGVPKDPKFIEAAAKVGALETALKEAQDATEQAGDALKKVLTERDELKKQRDQLDAALEVSTRKAQEQLEEVIEERDALSKQRDELVKGLAVAEVKLKTKGVLKSVPVEKERDLEELVSAEAKPAEGTPERAEYELRKVHAKGGRPLVAFGLPPATLENAR